MTAAATPSTTADRTADGGVLLADTLSVNALTSGVTGAVLILGAPWLDTTLGAPWVVLVGIGLGLLLFADGILLALGRPAQLRVAARAVVVADLAWVLAAVGVIAADVLTPLGDVLLGGVSVMVAGFAVAQAVGLRRAGDSGVLGTRPVEVTASRDVAAAPAAAWDLVADAAAYDAFAPGIRRTTTDGDLADGMRRTCVDDGGRTWSETCTAVDPGRGYRMEVDTATYPLRYRLLLHDFGMTWRVTPLAEGGSRLQVTFSGSTKLGLVGRLAMRALRRDDPAGQIVDAYARRLAATS